MDLVAALEFGNDTFTLILWQFGQSISLSAAFGWSCNFKFLVFILFAAAFIYLPHRHNLRVLGFEMSQFSATLLL
jgi:hypothetical protein